MNFPSSRYSAGSVGQRVPALITFFHSTAAGWVMWVLGVLLASLPLLQTTLPPIVDYPNHLARAYILANWEHFGSVGIYEWGGWLIPNVLGDVITMLLVNLTSISIFEAGRLLLGLILLSTLGGAFALHAAANGRLSPWPVLVVPFLYNEIFFWGFLNYLLGLALLLWGCAGWLVLERRSRAWQLLFGTIFAFAIFFAHLVAFALFAIAVGLLELRRAWFTRHDGARVVSVRLVSWAVCFVGPLVLFWLISPSGELDLRPNFNFTAFQKLSPFTRMLSSGNTLVDVVVLTAVAVVVGLLFARRWLSVHPGLMTIAGGFSILALALPSTMMGSSYLSSRIPIAAAIIGIIALRPRVMGNRRMLSADSRIAMLGCVLLIGLITIRSVIIAVDWRESDRHYRAILPAFEELPEDGLLVAATGTEWEDAAGWFETRTLHPPHEHVAHYATIVSGTPVLHLFARRGQNPVVLELNSDILQSMIAGPIRYVKDKDALNDLIERIREGAQEDSLFDELPVFLVTFQVPCSDWPDGSDAEPVFCDQEISVMQVSGEDEVAP